MSSEFAEVCTVGAGASGIDVGALPPLPDADALETHAKALSDAGTSINSSIGAASRTWTGMSGAYQAPEEGLVLAGFSPIAYRAASLQGTAEQCSSALLYFSKRTHDLKRRVEALRSDVSALDALILGNDDWQSKIDIVDQRREMYDRCSALAQEILDSDATCASSLNVLAGGEKVSADVIPRHSLDSSTDVLSNVFSHVQHFLGSDQEIPDQPWGAANVSLRAGGWVSVGQGALTAVVGGAQGLYTMLGTTDKAEQTLAWQGLGTLAGALFTSHKAITRADGKFSADELNALLIVGEAGKGVIHYDEWGRDPLYAAGSTAVDIVGLLAGGAGVGLKAGSVASKAGTAGAAAEKLGVASMDSAKLGKLAPAVGGSAAELGTAGTLLAKPSSLAVKISDVVMPETTAKLLDTLSDAKVEAFVPDGKTASAAEDLVPDAKTSADAADAGAEQAARVAEPPAVAVRETEPPAVAVRETEPPAVVVRETEPAPLPHPDEHGDVPGDGAKDPVYSSDESVEPLPREDAPRKPEDHLYGQPREDHGEHAPYPAATELNRETMELVADPDAPWGRATDDTPFTKAEYDARYTQPAKNGDPFWHVYPPNDGALPGTWMKYQSVGAYIRDHGAEMDRIGGTSGEFLGVMKDGLSASFEARSLPVKTLAEQYFKYRLEDHWPPGTEGWSLEVSKVAPAFGRDGGASQLLIRDADGLTVNVETMLEMGLLK